MRASAKSVWSWVRSAPGTYIWLLALLFTTLFLRHLPDNAEEHFLGKRSTNLHHLSEDPIRVLFSSAFWLEGGGWLGYLALFTIFHAPAERWLGTWRWLCVVVIAHVGATYISEGVLYEGIRHGYVAQSAVDTLDVGVSYGLAGVVGVLVYLVAKPWRYVYFAGALLFYAVPLIFATTFTAVGHMSALLLGVVCYPLTRARAGVWNPADLLPSRRGAPAS